jgi:hypothetical protein
MQILQGIYKMNIMKKELILLLLYYNYFFFLQQIGRESGFYRHEFAVL